MLCSIVVLACIQSVSAGVEPALCSNLDNANPQLCNEVATDANPEDSIDVHNVNLLQQSLKLSDVKSQDEHGGSEESKKKASPCHGEQVAVTANMTKSQVWRATHVDSARGSVSTGTACDPCGASSTYSEEIVDGDIPVRMVYSSGCPNHYNYMTGRQGGTGIGNEGDDTRATEQATHLAGYEIPAYPVLQKDGATTDIETKMGLIAIALNGVAFYGGAVDSDGNLLDVTDDSGEWTSFDFCSGHATDFGEYHYHFPPSCLLAKLTSFSDGHSPQIGWSLDGFPVYGPKGPNGIAMRVCGNEGADDTHCLDSCGGMEAELSSVDNFKYRYYVTGATSDLSSLPGDPKPEVADYPFTLKCQRGCTMAKLEAGKKKCTNGEDGYTTAYTPAATTGVSDVFTFDNTRLCGTATTTAANTCEAWCESNTKSWSKKCNWDSCSGCSSC